MPKKPKVIVVMPAYNATKTVLDSYRRLPKKLIAEIILIDDASTDATYQVAKRLTIKVYRNEINLGYGGNLKRCLTMALEHGADIVIEYHPDNQYDPSDLALFLQKADTGYDFALGSRFIHPKEALDHKMPLVKFVANRALSFIDEFILGLELSEFHSGFRMYTRKLLTSVPYLQNSDDYLFSFEIIVQAVYKKLRIAEIPIACDYHPKMHTANLHKSTIYALGTFMTLGQYLVSKFSRSPVGPFVAVSPVSCSLCRKKITRKESSVLDAVKKKNFSIWYCSLCKIAFTELVPQNLATFYPGTYYTNLKTRLYALLQRRRVKLLTGLVSGKKNKIIDIGCGDGVIGDVLEQRGFSYVGIEAPFATTRNPKVKSVGAEGIREKKNSFSVVTFWETFEHLRDPITSLKKAYSLLQPGGFVVIECPNYEALERKLFRSRWFHLDPPRHLFHFTKAGLANKLEAAGFKITRQENVYALEYMPYGLAQSILYSISPRLNLLEQSNRGMIHGAVVLFLILMLIPVTLPISFVAYLWGTSPIMLTVAYKPKK